jgi:hypothetical protein
VRQRLLRGESPLVGHDNGHNGSEAALVAEPEAPVTGPCDAVPLRSHALFEDTALKSMQYGEEFVKMMAAHWISPDDWSKYVGIIPLSRVYIVADLARTYATAWMAFADALVARTAKRSG